MNTIKILNAFLIIGLVVFNQSGMAAENLCSSAVQQSPETKLVKEGPSPENVERELRAAYQALKVVDMAPKSVTIFGSARLKPGSHHYNLISDLSYDLGKLGFAIVTGGGPGIMEAANQGAHRAGALSAGLGIQLPFETKLNPYLSTEAQYNFKYFFTRKVLMTRKRDAFIAGWGGIGTLDELFEILNLIQTRRIPARPVILVGEEWSGLISWMKNSLVRSGVVNADLMETIYHARTKQEALAFFLAGVAKNEPQSPFQTGAIPRDLGQIEVPIGEGPLPKSVLEELQNAYAKLIRIEQLPKTVAIFGSARLKESDPHYQTIREIARRLGTEGYGIVTGGGPGIMEAGNRGAREAGAPSAGLSIKLPFEEKPNVYVDDDLSFTFKYFFTRKVLLSRKRNAFVVGWGGVGTLDEFFEILTLIQTQKMPPPKIVLVGKEWNQLREWMQSTMVSSGTISPSDLDLFKIVETVDQAVDAVTGRSSLKSR